MNIQEYEFIESLYWKCRQLLKQIDAEKNPEDYAKLKLKFDEIEIMDEILKNIKPRVKDHYKKIDAVRKQILFSTNGTVNLDDKMILAIIEKSVL